MTTKPESPDSGASALGDMIRAGMAKIDAERASAGDQAAAPFGYLRREVTTGGAFTSLHTEIQGFEDDEFNTPIYTRAQDAAGKGVEPTDICGRAAQLPADPDDCV